MQNIDQQDPAQSIIGNNRHKVVDGRDQRTGRNGRVYMDFFEEQRDTGTDCPGYDHRQYQRETDASGHQ